DEKTGAAEDEESGPQREQWSNGIEFLMSCIAMSVGLGNIWRFPFIAFSNGGGAFLIPYIVVLFLIGKPLYYLEMAIGQFVSGGPVKVWVLSPALKGIGYGQMLATIMVVTYYCSLMALVGFYFVQSFAAELPWATCSEEWDNCFDSKMADHNSSNTVNLTGRTSSSELYFYKYVLKELDSIEDGIGDPDWRLTLCLFVAWLTIFLVIIRGVKSSGKAAYFLAMFPYVVLIALLIRGATLPGAAEGIQYFFEPQWEELLNPKVWYSAVTQCFFSLNVCFGTVIMYSSYNEFNHNVYRDSMIVTILDMFTSLLAGCTIFCILGNLIYEMGVDDIRSVVKGGPGLAFVSYPDAIAKFDAVPQLFAVLFFIMLYVLGVGSAVALIGAVITIVRDSLPNLNYMVVASVASVLGFIAGLVYITPGGQYILTLVDFYGANFSVFVLGTIEIIGVAWVYGVNNVCDDLEFMLGKKTGAYWRICWGFVTPVLMLVILVYSVATMEPEKYNDQPFPTAAYAAGWIIFTIGVAQLPLWAVFVMYKKRGGSFLETIMSAFQTSELWRPQNNAAYKKWKDFKEKKRRELELIVRDETVWQKIVRYATGYSPLRSSIEESNNTQDKY
ncbi:hypothetical protein Cfor_09809, partial [Coptotermes formosanus]